jgi:hypothetical protein
MNRGPIFLAAGLPERDLGKYMPNHLAVCNAIGALLAESVRDRLLVLGNHPSISPLVVEAARSLDAIENVRLYGSDFFRSELLTSTETDLQVIWTEAVPGDRDRSLRLLYEKMIRSQSFVAAFFMGGMGGVEEEWAIFCKEHPHAAALPVGSTGGAARLLWQSWTPPDLPWVQASIKDRLGQDLNYRGLFREILALNGDARD